MAGRSFLAGRLALVLVLWAGGSVRADEMLTPTQVASLNRLTFGVNDSLLSSVSSLGYEAWLKAQLHPSADKPVLPPAIASLIDGYDRLAGDPGPWIDKAKDLKTAAEDARDAYQKAHPQADMTATTDGKNMAGDMQAPPAPSKVVNEFRKQSYSQAEYRRLLNEIYAPDQLRQQMLWFWSNHFNVLWNKGEIAYRLGDYEDRVLKPHALGRFRDLLEADLRHPVMLHYLDNQQNAAGHINENYARELLELHTMGVGSGYSQADVEALAHILTGATIAPRDKPVHVSKKNEALLVQDGDFLFNPDKHDFSDKVFLGQKIHGAGYSEITQALDIICRQPATAHFIAHKLAQYFVADEPAKDLVDSLAARFTDSKGDIAETLDLLFHSQAYQDALAKPLLKDPEHYVVSAMRLAYDGQVIVNPVPVESWINRLGQPLYGRITPDGYPITRGFWNGSGQMEQRFEIAKAIGGGAKRLFRSEEAVDPPSAPKPDIQSSRTFASYVVQAADRATLAALAQAKNAGEWNAFLLSSPEFMGR